MVKRARALPADIRERIAHLGNLGRVLPTTRRRRDDDTQTRASAFSPLLQNRWLRTWRFPSQAGADRWNAEWDGVIERPGSIHRALVTVGGAPLQDRSLDPLARIAGLTLCDEVRGGAPCPYMTERWSFRLRIEYTVPAPMRAGPEHPVVIALHGDALGPQGSPQWSCDATRGYTADLIPGSVVALWSSRRWSPVAETYR